MGHFFLDRQYNSYNNNTLNKQTLNNTLLNKVFAYNLQTHYVSYQIFCSKLYYWIVDPKQKCGLNYYLKVCKSIYYLFSYIQTKWFMNTIIF